MGLMHEFICLTPLATEVSLNSLLATKISGDTAGFDIPDSDALSR